MSRLFIDCRDVPSKAKCTVAISAEKDDELVEAAVQHAIAVHEEHDSPELRRMIRGAMKNGSPPP